MHAEAVLVNQNFYDYWWYSYHTIQRGKTKSKKIKTVGKPEIQPFHSFCQQVFMTASLFHIWMAFHWIFLFSFIFFYFGIFIIHVRYSVKRSSFKQVELPTDSFVCCTENSAFAWKFPRFPSSGGRENGKHERMVEEKEKFVLLWFQLEMEWKCEL